MPIHAEYIDYKVWQASVDRYQNEKFDLTEL